MYIPKYKTIEKRTGETPLEATERLREKLKLKKSVPMAYAGRLDPMASGTLLILIGDECKKQESYHNLDKAYDFQILFGVHSDSGDSLGIVKSCKTPQSINEGSLRSTLSKLIGPLTLPYPHFSSKAVEGKPLHVWTLEGRLNEIEIPTRSSYIHSLSLKYLENKPFNQLYEEAMGNIDSISPVHELSKALGENFRRDTVKSAWNALLEEQSEKNMTIASFTSICSSGTYIRSLSSHIAEKFGTCGLAFSIKRTAIGNYKTLFGNFGIWLNRY